LIDCFIPSNHTKKAPFCLAQKLIPHSQQLTSPTQRALPEILKELQLRWTLPRNYEKVCDFAGQPTVVKLRDTTFVNAGKVADLPFTVAFDAATLPIQVCLMIFFKDVGKDIN
jgi:uncharacterized protein YceK